MRDVVCGHPSRGEAFLEPFAQAPAIEFPQPFYGLNSLLFVIDHKTGDAFDSWSGPLLIGDQATTTKTYRVFPTPLPILVSRGALMAERSRLGRGFRLEG